MEFESALRLVEKLFLSLGEMLKGHLKSAGALLCLGSFLGMVRDCSPAQVAFPCPSAGSFGSHQRAVQSSAAQPSFWMSVLDCVWGRAVDRRALPLNSSEGVCQF